MLVVPIINGIQSYPWARRYRGKAEFLSDTVIKELETAMGPCTGSTPGRSAGRGYIWAYTKGGPSPWNVGSSGLLNWVEALAYKQNHLLACGYSYGGHDLVRELLEPLARAGVLAKFGSVRVLVVDADWFKLDLFGQGAVLGLPRGVKHAINLYQRAQPRPQGALLTAEDCPHLENLQVRGATHDSIDNCGATRAVVGQLIREAMAEA